MLRGLKVSIPERSKENSEHDRDDEWDAERGAWSWGAASTEDAALKGTRYIRYVIRTARNGCAAFVPGRVRTRPGTRAATTDGWLLVESDYAEDAIGVVVRTGGEEELVVGAVGAAVMAELNPPEAVDFDGLAGGVAQRAKKSA